MCLFGGFLFCFVWVCLGREVVFLGWGVWFWCVGVGCFLGWVWGFWVGLRGFAWVLGGFGLCCGGFVVLGFCYFVGQEDGVFVCWVLFR